MKENDVVISTILISISNSFFSVLVLHFKKVFLLSRSIHKSEKGQMWGQEARSGSEGIRNGFSTSKWINQVWSCQFTYRFSSQTHIVRLTVWQSARVFKWTSWRPSSIRSTACSNSQLNIVLDVPRHARPPSELKWPASWLCPWARGLAGTAGLGRF